MGRNSLEATNARLIRIARADGCRLRRVLFARADRAPDRPAPFLVVAVFFDPVFDDGFAAALEAEASGFLGAEEESEV
jgi:hypothetical protein